MLFRNYLHVCYWHTGEAADDLIFAFVCAAKGKGSSGVKTAKLYAWVALQTLPEEMVISPCLLDFLEKALETIPITPVERNYTGVFQMIQTSASYTSVVSVVFVTTCFVWSSQRWLPTRTTWVSLMRNSWRNPPLLWCPPQHQPTPPFPWMWLSTSEFRYSPQLHF